MLQSQRMYEEDNSEEFGVINKWMHVKVLDSVLTDRETLIEMVERPGWGLACYMNNSIQSCLKDEKIYHESLVHPIMSSCTPERVCIFGGGEGATAREVLKFPSVRIVDMYEWDETVINLFKEKYPEWAKGAWNDSRLNIHTEDIFEAINYFPDVKYDVLIIDLFDPSEENKDNWVKLLNKLHNWVKFDGAIVLYAGMRNILAEQNQPYQILQDIITETDNWHGVDLPKSDLYYKITPYRVWIPSFSGESTFLLLTPPLQQSDSANSEQLDFDKLKAIGSHITEPIWNSYKVFNW